MLGEHDTNYVHFNCSQQPYLATIHVYMMTCISSIGSGSCSWVSSKKPSKDFDLISMGKLYMKVFLVHILEHKYSKSIVKSINVATWEAQNSLHKYL